MGLTPHGAGFSFLDRLELLEPGKRARGIKWLDPAAPFFTDHFPGRPIMPGVLLIECAAQAAGALWAQPQAFLARVQQFRFLKPVLPAQTVEMEVALEKDFGALAQFDVALRVEGEMVAAGKITLSGRLEGHAPSWPNAVSSQDTNVDEILRGSGRAPRVPPKRKTPSHMPPVSAHNRSIIVFLTVCTDHRKPILARDDVHQLLLESWRETGTWSVGRYVLMPDHVHLFCAPNTQPPVALEQWVQFWKSHASRRWPRPDEQPVWQKSFWDTQLRRGEGYGNKWEYVRHNPVRHGLVARPEDWQYQGDLNVLEWHD